MSKLIFTNPTLAASGNDQRLPMMKPDAKRGRFLVSTTNGASGARNWVEFAFGRRVIPDFGHRFYGGICFDPFDKKVVADGAPPPEIPDDGRKWQRVYEFPIYDPELEMLFMFSVTSPLEKASINMNRIASILALWSYAPEAARGLLQEYIVRSFTPADTPFGTFQGLVLEPTGVWVERTDPPYPSPRLQPPPSVILGGPTPPPKLPPTTTEAEPPAVPAPANDDPLHAFRSARRKATY
jgi:hypothetical protein